MNIIDCPHCNGSVEILELNCKIFRHAILIKNGQQINPHASQKECENLYINNLIYGCGKPFMIEINKDNVMIAIKCDYI